ncbi:hypothetical protein L3i22_010720 [Actinoplanes sp. L3-i22]|nr:hypothetical protein L3i22_010720 [Actinoplanes sp. L3-i22]
MYAVTRCSLSLREGPTLTRACFAAVSTKNPGCSALHLLVSQGVESVVSGVSIGPDQPARLNGKKPGSGGPPKGKKPGSAGVTAEEAGWADREPTTAGDGLKRTLRRGAITHGDHDDTGVQRVRTGHDDDPLPRNESEVHYASPTPGLTRHLRHI